jgi:rubrerythrin
MFGKNPLELPGRDLAPEEICDALRIALAAELDAVTLYSQFARRIKDPLVSKVFLAVAEEEKEHIGEFLTLLKKCDKSLDAMIEKGREEVVELEESQNH